jgi:hypothetical protein
MSTDHLEQSRTCANCGHSTKSGVLHYHRTPYGYTICFTICPDCHELLLYLGSNAGQTDVTVRATSTEVRSRDSVRGLRA